MYALGIIAYELLTGFHPYQRHSAPAARKLGIKPAPLKGLKRKEARAIERCLSFDRKQRPQNAGEFLKVFRGVTALQKATLAAAAVLALAAGYLWYQNYLETSPAIPFSELPSQMQAEFRSNDEGRRTSSGCSSSASTSPMRRWQPSISTAEAYATSIRAIAKLSPRSRRQPTRCSRCRTSTRRARQALAKDLQNKSTFYEKYAPVVDAIRE